MSLCANCGKQNAEGATECFKCGSPIGGEHMEVLSLQLGGVCSTCDSYNEPGVRVCQTCGTPLSAEAAADVAQYAEEPPAPSAFESPPEPQAWAGEPAPEEELSLSEPDTTPAYAEAPAPEVWPDDQTQENAAPAEPPPEEDLEIDISEEEPALPPARPPPMPMTTAQLPAAKLLAEVAALRGGGTGAPPPGPPPGYVEQVSRPAEQQPIKLAPKPAAAPGRADDQPCPRCSSMNPPVAKFCGTCGNKLAGLAAPAAAAGAPTALAPGRAKLILIRGSGFEGATFRLNSDSAAAGRSQGLVLFPSDAYLADHHATFLYDDGKLVVRDEGGVNGLFVRLRGSVPLRPGDAFVVGERLLRWSGPLDGAPPQGGDCPKQGAPRPSGELFGIEELLLGGREGRRFVRPGPMISMGRANCDINWPADGFVSARHAEITMHAGEATLTDAGSANGTYLRLGNQEQRSLAHGDYLLMGRQLLRVEIAAA